MSSELRRVLVWPGSVRVTHWVLAASTLVLIATGWLLQTGLVGSDELHELLADGLHRPAGHLFALALAVRLLLLFAGSRVARWRALIPDAVGREGIRDTLRFYSRVGSSRPPRYYAHNPLWGLLYLVFFGLAAAQAVTGLALELDAVRALLRAEEPALLSLHGRLAQWLLVWSVFHVATAVLHDWRGQGSDTSAMISGYRIFVPERPATDALGRVTSVRIDTIGRPPARGRPGEADADAARPPDP